MEKDKRVVFNKDTDVVETGRVRWEEHGDRPHLQSHQQAHQQAKESQNQPWVDRLKFTTSKPTTPKTSGERNSIGIQISPSIEMPDIKADTAKMEQGFKERQAELKAKTEEEQEAKHRKAEKMWSAIGDGISAIANMATVGAGADSMYNPADSLHSKVKSKWDEIKANKAAIAAANRKAQMDLLLADLGYQHASKENEKNRQSKWDEFWAKLQETNRHNQEMEAIAKDRAESYETNAQANKTRASKYKGGGSSGGGKNSQGKWELVGPDGKTEYYDTQAEWEARAKEIAPEVGVSLTTNSGWKKVKKDAKQVVAEVNAANKKKAEKPKSTGKKLNLLQ